jgi:hypothetical protein
MPKQDNFSGKELPHNGYKLKNGEKPVFRDV